METREFYRSKVKSFFVAIIGAVILVVGIYVLMNPETMVDDTKIIYFYNNAVYTRFMCILAILVSSLALIASLKNIFAAKAVLSISEQGICVNIGEPIEILWEEIKSFEIENKKDSTNILIMLKEPMIFNERLKGRAAKFLVGLNNKMCGTPTVITTSTFSISRADLNTLLQDKLAAYKAAAVMV